MYYSNNINTALQIGKLEERNFTTVDALHKDLSNPRSKYHDPELAATEEEILQFYIRLGNFLNHTSHTDVSAGKDFFELKGYSIFDLMGTVFWPDLEPHYDHITPYLGKTNQRFREVEIVAVTKDFGYITAVQRVDGKLLMVDGGEWKYIHEHYSFPVDMATKIADFTGKQEATESVEFKRKETL
ncbi:unnamed protein product [Clonostachys chloroleuca]|uniref:Uncharacterized protein n=1 Tax=Clonostachys chloroleuca TaxID=1926264 RepID=A0AA35M2K9_9HYPO|nr:unnamed protein product [Clonostachys chloroleuca]